MRVMGRTGVPVGNGLGGIAGHYGRLMGDGGNCGKFVVAMGAKKVLLKVWGTMESVGQPR